MYHLETRCLTALQQVGWGSDQSCQAAFTGRLWIYCKYKGQIKRHKTPTFLNISEILSPNQSLIVVSLCESSTLYFQTDFMNSKFVHLDKPAKNGMSVSCEVSGHASDTKRYMLNVNGYLRLDSSRSSQAQCMQWEAILRSQHSA